VRLASKLLEHIPDMVRYRRAAAAADVVHFQWLSVQSLDRHLLPAAPTVLTAHDLLPREPRRGWAQVTAQRRLYDAVDAVVAHSEYGRGLLVEQLGLAPAKVRVIHHGAFEHLTRLGGVPLPTELSAPPGPVVLFFGLLRPYKGIDVLLDAWKQLTPPEGAELWIVGRPRMRLESLRSLAGGSARFVPRFVSDGELAACFRAADLVVLPYVETERLDFSGVLATALAFAKPTVVSDVGGFSEVAATGAAALVPPGDPEALARCIGALLGDPGARQRIATAAMAAAAGPYSWTEAARGTLALYRELAC
jgi:glycosyltransferase involved in cell wall biosynthesis